MGTHRAAQRLGSTRQRRWSEPPAELSTHLLLTILPRFGTNGAITRRPNAAGRTAGKAGPPGLGRPTLYRVPPRIHASGPRPDFDPITSTFLHPARWASQGRGLPGIAGVVARRRCSWRRCIEFVAGGKSRSREGGPRLVEAAGPDRGSWAVWNVDGDSHGSVSMASPVGSVAHVYEVVTDGV